MPRQVKSTVLDNASSDTIWGAAVYAQRCNGAYIKEMYNEGDQIPNKVIAMKAIENTTVLTAEDINSGKEIRKHFKGSVMFKAVKNSLTSFDKIVSKAVALDQWTKKNALEFAVLVSLPQSYSRAIKRDEVDDYIEELNSTHIGKIKERIKANVTIIRSNYSHKWDCHYTTAVTAAHNVVWFAYKSKLVKDDRISIAGTIKAHRDQGQTQLNRVKIIE